MWEDLQTEILEEFAGTNDLVYDPRRVDEITYRNSQLHKQYLREKERWEQVKKDPGLHTAAKKRNRQSAKRYYYEVLKKDPEKMKKKRLSSRAAVRKPRPKPEGFKKRVPLSPEEKKRRNYERTKRYRARIKAESPEMWRRILDQNCGWRKKNPEKMRKLANDWWHRVGKFNRKKKQQEGTS